MKSRYEIYLKQQTGFALIVVLITLMILSLVVASLLRNQTSSLHETSIMFAATENEQNARNAHQACIERIRSDLKINNAAQISWARGNANQLNVSSNGNAVDCQLTLVGVPVGGGGWAPLLSMTSVVGTISHTTQLRYEPCVGADVCASTANAITAIGAAGIVSLSPTWKAGSLVQVSGQ